MNKTLTCLAMGVAYLAGSAGINYARADDSWKLERDGVSVSQQEENSNREDSFDLFFPASVLGFILYTEKYIRRRK